jgi:hypothetical protein
MSSKEPDRVLGDGAKGDLEHPERTAPAADPAAAVNTDQDKTVDTAADAASKNDSHADKE